LAKKSVLSASTGPSLTKLAPSAGRRSVPAPHRDLSSELDRTSQEHYRAVAEIIGYVMRLQHVVRQRN
jgi:hypothetical protein